MNSIAESALTCRAMEQALQTPLPATWMKDDPTYRAAEQCQEIGRVLVDKIHKHLVNCSIGYVFKQSLTDAWAKASLVSGKLHFYSGHDALIEVNWEAWKKLKPRQRVALIDHELCHFGRDDEAIVMQHHDVEEFGAIIVRWGPWEPSLVAFHRVMVEQTDLFVEDPAPAEDAAGDKPDLKIERGD